MRALSSLYNSMPPQKVSEAQKDTAWGNACVNAITNMSGQNGAGRRMSPEMMQVCYNLRNGIYDEKDFNYVTNPTNDPDLTKKGGTPARLQMYNIISSKLNELEGEEIKRPFNFRAYGTSGGVFSREKEKRLQLMQEGLQRLLLEEMGMEADPEQVPLEQVEEYFKTKYKDPAEVGANQILKFLVPHLKVQMQFNKGFRHVLAVAEEYFAVYVRNGEPALRACNPLNCSYDLDPDLEFVEDGQWFREERWMTLGSIVDEFREYLEDSDIAQLDGRYTGHYGNGSPTSQGFAYSNIGSDVPDWEKDVEVYRLGIDPGSTTYGGRPLSSANLIPVVRVVWKSMREISFLTYKDDEGKEQQSLVDGKFSLSAEQKKQGFTLDRQWITDVWEGTKIGSEIYVNVRPLENQTGKLPYVGMVFNNLNSRATSLIEQVKNIQYLYMVVWYRLEDELAKAKGKAVSIDLAQIPRTGEWAMSLDQWLYYKEKLGIMWRDSSQEGNEGDPRLANNTNPTPSVDQTISNNVVQYIQIINKLEEMVGNIIGVSRQREGNITSNETVGGVERSVQQSSNITEPLFYYHNLVKQNVLVQLVELAKLCYIDGKHGQYIVDDVYREWLNVDGGLLNDSEFGVFIRDSSADAALIQKMNMLADRALQAGEARLSSIIGMLDTQSVSEMRSMLLQAEDAKDKRDAEQAKMQQDMQTAQLAQQANEAAADKEFTAEQNALNRENDIRKTYITATKGVGDGNANGIPDGTELLKAASEDQKNYLKNLELQHKAATAQREQARKEQEATQKTTLEATKLQLQARDQELKHAQFMAQQAANEREQAQQNRMHADKQKMDRELLALKQKEVKAKIKQANKPKK